MKDYFEEIEGVLPRESATVAHESPKGDRREIRKLMSFLGLACIVESNMRYGCGWGK